MNLESFQSLLEGAWGVLLIVLFFGGSIFVHELGHFLAARKRGLKIERFSIGIGPRLFGWTGKDGVDYRVSLFPVGGYVALPQMVDMEAIEGKNATDADSLPPISYADKMIVAVMGAVFNILFAFLLACVLWAIKMPIPESTLTTTIGYAHPDLPGKLQPGPARAAGLLPGDKVLAVDGSPVRNFREITERIYFGTDRDAEGKPQTRLAIQRGDQQLDIIVNPEMVEHNPVSGDAIRRIGIESAADIFITQPAPESPAGKAGLQQGDQIIAINGTAIYSLMHLRELMADNGTAPVQVTVKTGPERAERTVSVTPTLRTDTTALAQITFKEGLNTRVLRLVAVPDDIFTKDPKAQRRNLMIFDTLPTSSEFSSVLRPGTVVASIDLPGGIRVVRSPQELAQAAQENKNDTVTLFTHIGDHKQSVTLPDFKAEAIPAKSLPYLGIRDMLKVELIRQTPIEQFQYAFGVTFTTLGKLIDRKSDVQINHLMGVVSMAKTYYTVADDIRRVLWFTIIININLAILNLLPLPVLDGGHMLIATIQKLLGRPIPIKIIASLQYIFVVFFLSLMAFVIFNDVRRCRGDSTLGLRNQIFERYVTTDVSFDEKQE